MFSATRAAGSSDAGPCSTRRFGPYMNNDGQPITSTSRNPSVFRYSPVNSPRTPMVADRSSTAEVNRFTRRSRSLPPRDRPPMVACAPTPTTTTGMVSFSMSSLNRSRASAKPGRNALASGIAKALNSALICGASRASARNRVDTVSVREVVRSLCTALLNTRLPTLFPITLSRSVTCGETTSNGSLPDRTRIRGMGSALPGQEFPCQTTQRCGPSAGRFAALLRRGARPPGTGLILGDVADPLVLVQARHPTVEPLHTLGQLSMARVRQGPDRPGELDLGDPGVECCGRLGVAERVLEVIAVQEVREGLEPGALTIVELGEIGLCVQIGGIDVRRQLGDQPMRDPVVTGKLKGPRVVRQHDRRGTGKQGGDVPVDPRPEREVELRQVLEPGPRIDEEPHPVLPVQRVGRTDQLRGVRRLALVVVPPAHELERGDVLSHVHHLRVPVACVQGEPGHPLDVRRDVNRDFAIAVEGGDLLLDPEVRPVHEHRRAPDDVHGIEAMRCRYSDVNSPRTPIDVVLLVDPPGLRHQDLSLIHISEPTRPY